MLKRFYKSNKTWIKIVLVVYVLTFLILGVVGFRWAVKFIGYTSIVLLILTLTPKRLAYWFSKDSGIHKFSTKLIVHRRAIGVSTAFTMLLHVALVMNFYGNLDIAFYFKEGIRPGFISEVILFTLLITSGAYVTRKLGKYWKSVHRLVWIVVPLLFVHVKVANDIYDPSVSTHVIANLLLLFAIIVAVVDLFVVMKRKEKLNIPLITLGMILIGTIIAVFV